MKNKDLFILFFGILSIATQIDCSVASSTKYDGLTASSQYN